MSIPKLTQNQHPIYHERPHTVLELPTRKDDPPPWATDPSSRARTTTRSQSRQKTSQRNKPQFALQVGRVGVVQERQDSGQESVGDGIHEPAQALGSGSQSQGRRLASNGVGQGPCAKAGDDDDEDHADAGVARRRM